MLGHLDKEDNLFSVPTLLSEIVDLHVMYTNTLEYSL